MSFGFGDTVRTLPTDELGNRGGQLAEVCDVVRIETKEHAKAVIGGGVGKTAYTIEFGDGESQEVTEDFIERP